MAQARDLEESQSGEGARNLDHDSSYDTTYCTSHPLGSPAGWTVQGRIWGLLPRSLPTSSRLQKAQGETVHFLWEGKFMAVEERRCKDL